MTALPHGWRMATIEEVAASEPRSITDGPFGSHLTRAHYTASGPRVVRLQNIGDGRFIDAPAHISQEHFESLRTHEVLPGDLLMASLGETLPRACLAPESLGPAIVKADCIRVRLSDEVDPRWVQYALQRPAVRRWADDHRHGVGRPRLGLKVIRQTPVPLPELSEQRRIVDILEDHLSRLDAADELRRVSATRSTALQRSSLSAVIDQSGRRRVPLRELVRGIEAGRSFGGAAAPAGPHEWGIVRVSAMTWGSFRADQNKTVPMEKVDVRHEIRAGDLLVSRANTNEYVGASVLVGDVRPRLLLSDKSLRVKPREGVDARWLQLALSTPSARSRISALATGTKDSMRNISQGNLLSVEVPDVAAAVQEADIAALAHRFEAVERLAASVNQLGRRSDALRRALLAAAFSGRLTGRVSDMDRVEELATAGATW